MAQYDYDFEDDFSRLSMVDDDAYTSESEGESTYEPREHAARGDRYTAHIGPKGEVPYLSKKSRKACVVTFSLGFPVMGHTQASGTLDADHQWAVVLHNKPRKGPTLYGAPKGNVHVSGSGMYLRIEPSPAGHYFINHSAFRRGKPVAAAGLMRWDPIQQQYLVWNHSGHYQPTPANANILGRFLANNGVRFTMLDSQSNFMFTQDAFGFTGGGFMPMPDPFAFGGGGPMFPPGLFGFPGGDPMFAADPFGFAGGNPAFPPDDFAYNPAAENFPEESFEFTRSPSVCSCNSVSWDPECPNVFCPISPYH